MRRFYGPLRARSSGARRRRRRTRSSPTIVLDGPPRMEARPTGSGRERSSPNRCDQCRGQARHPTLDSRHMASPRLRNLNLMRRFLGSPLVVLAVMTMLLAGCAAPTQLNAQWFNPQFAGKPPIGAERQAARREHHARRHHAPCVRGSDGREPRRPRCRRCAVVSLSARGRCRHAAADRRCGQGIRCAGGADVARPRCHVRSLHVSPGAGMWPGWGGPWGGPWGWGWGGYYGGLWGGANMRATGLDRRERPCRHAASSMSLRRPSSGPVRRQPRRRPGVRARAQILQQFVHLIADALGGRQAHLNPGSGARRADAPTPRHPACRNAITA